MTEPDPETPGICCSLPVLGWGWQEAPAGKISAADSHTTPQTVSLQSSQAWIYMCHHPQGIPAKLCPFHGARCTSASFSTRPVASGRWKGLRTQRPAVHVLPWMRLELSPTFYSLRFGFVSIFCSAGQMTTQLSSHSPLGSEAQCGSSAQGLPGLKAGVAGAEVTSRLLEIVAGFIPASSKLSVAVSQGPPTDSCHVAPTRAGQDLAVGSFSEASRTASF